MWQVPLLLALLGLGLLALLGGSLIPPIRARRSCRTVLIVLGVGALVAAMGAFAIGPGSHNRQARSSDLALEKVHPAAARAVTDRGRPVPLFEPNEPREPAELAEQESDQFGGRGLPDIAVRRGPAGDESNCYGWLFAGGRYLVAPEMVDVILQDNGYQPVESPRPGDLVIYRRDGACVHGAVVRYVTAGQPVLVEGKWGWAGVFLHPVGGTGYGNNFTYYRSRRAGHLLAGLGSSAADLVAKDSPRPLSLPRDRPHN